ncbi:hypothetical protein D3C80_1541060 [compost metagenome]
MTVRHRGEGEAQPCQQAFHCSAELEGVLQGAGAMEGHALFGAQAKLLDRLFTQHFHQVTGQGADPCSLGGVLRVLLQQVGIIAHKRAAAACRLHDGFGTCLDGRPPSVDIAPGALQTLGLGVEVVIHRATATGLADRFDADAEAVQQACGGGVGIGRQCRLHAPFEQQHPARMARRRSLPGCGDLGRQLAFECRWQ